MPVKLVYRIHNLPLTTMWELTDPTAVEGTAEHVEADGKDTLISQTHYEWFRYSGRYTEDDDGYIDHEGMWIAGDPHPITRLEQEERHD